MALQINWTANALEDYNKIVDYRKEEWSFSIAEKFIELVEGKLETLSHFPLLGISSIKEPAIRSISITKHNRLFYRLSQSGIEVLSIFDRSKIRKKINLIKFLYNEKRLNYDVLSAI